MNYDFEITPVSEGFLNLFKKKSKQPSRLEKSNINDRMKPGKTSNNISIKEINTKLVELYPNDAKKEFDNRQKFLKETLNIITEFSKKYKNVPGISFEDYINELKNLINHKDSDYRFYDEFGFIHDLLPSCGPSQDKYSWGYSSNFYINIFWYDIWEWAQSCEYKEEFKSGKRLVRSFDDTKEWYSILETIENDFRNKFKSFDFFYNVDCGGDWDDGNYSIALKPSKEILTLANRCSSYKETFN